VSLVVCLQVSFVLFAKICPLSLELFVYNFSFFEPIFKLYGLGHDESFVELTEIAQGRLYLGRTTVWITFLHYCWFLSLFWGTNWNNCSVNRIIVTIEIVELSFILFLLLESLFLGP